MDKKAIVALSGGMDSVTVLAWLLDQGHEVHAVTFAYGSKHMDYELKAARDIISRYRIPRYHFNLEGVFSNFRSNLLKTGGEIPEGHYTDESMKLTVVPGRNIIFTSILAGLAQSIEAEYIALGIHQGDHAIYPDCRAEFFDAMNNAILHGTGGIVRFIAPFLNTDKEGILKWGVEHNVPYHLTRTCYKDQQLACGKCGSCVERLEAFAKIGQEDPVTYE
jgi:7-cyano-7-deazaguanine synthase